MPYKEKLMALLSMVEIKPGTIIHASIGHDDDCPALQGKECECDPHIGFFGESEVSGSKNAK